MAKSSNKDKTTEINTDVEGTTEPVDSLEGTQTESIAKKDGTVTSYDIVPYESYPYPVTHPTHMQTIATLFGLDSAKMEKARVLELGCAGGGNLMSLAMDYPKAEFYGIDLSKEQIDQGEEHRKALKIKNLKLEQMDIAKFSQDKGQFDYIICHGVFSWVPDPVRDKILEICSKHLSENGLAIISYNCLPGWAAVRSVRDMLLFHTARFENPDDKVKQARLLLQFLSENTPKDSPYKSILDHEKAILGRTNKDYILHEYLEEVNNQYYFHEFMSLANDHNLQYVADSNVSTMFTGNMPKGAAEKLSAVNNIIEQEQYMDYIRNRRFRYSILTHKDRDVTRNIDASVIYDLYVISHFEAEEAVANDNKKVAFRNPGQKNPITISDPGTKAVFQKMGEHKGQPVKLDAIIKEVAKDYKLDESTLKIAMQTNIIRLVLSGYIKLASEPVRWVTSVSEKPAVYELARYQGGLPNQSWVTNTERRRIRINQMTGKILSLADGTKTVPDLVKELQNYVSDNEMKVMSNGKEVTDKKEIEKTITNIVSNTLRDASGKALLIS